MAPPQTHKRGCRTVATMPAMQCRIDDVVLHYAERGTGVPLLALHGAGVDHREVEAALEPLVPSDGLRRLYPDLPAMGRSTADGLTGNDDVVALLARFVEQQVGGPVLLLGHSYGAYVARGVAAQRPDLVLGLALVCPLGGSSGDVPEQRAVVQEPDAYRELEPDQRACFDEYFVVRTPATARRYRDSVLPGTLAVDKEALGRVFSGWTVDVDREVYCGPTLIVAGRRDSTVGHAAAMRLVDRYPRAALAVLEDAGHALLHERPEIVAPLLHDWIDRARPTG